MALKQDTTLRRSSGAASVLRTQAPPRADQPQSPLLDGVAATLRGDVARFVAVAPGRLDVMGGLAEYTGALVLNVPLGQHACAAVQRRGDGVLSIVCSSAPDENGDTPTEIALSKLFPGTGKVIDAETGLRLPAGDSSQSTRCVLGALVEALRAGLLPPFPGGLSIAFALTADLTPVAGAAAALSAATLAAAAGALDAPLDARETAQVCQQVENAWLDLYRCRAWWARRKVSWTMSSASCRSLQNLKEKPNKRSWYMMTSSLKAEASPSWLRRTRSSSGGAWAGFMACIMPPSSTSYTHGISPDYRGFIRIPNQREPSFMANPERGP